MMFGCCEREGVKSATVQACCHQACNIRRNRRNVEFSVYEQLIIFTFIVPGTQVKSVAQSRKISLANSKTLHRVNTLYKFYASSERSNVIT